MAINPNQISVAKIYPGNYTNVLRYWHSERNVQYQNANGIPTTFTNQPVGGPVGVIFRPGWIAQQAIGYVDMSYQALGTINQLEYYVQPYGSGQNGANQPFSSASVIIPSPDFHKDVRPDISDGIQVPSGVYCYRASIRLTGGDIISSGIAGGSTTPAIALAPAVGEGYPDDDTVVSGAFAAQLTGADSRIVNGSTTSTNIINSSLLEMTTSQTQWVLSASEGSTSPVVAGSGTYDPRARNLKFAGENKSLAICEVCWLVPDSPPERQDVALQPDGVTESSVFTSTVPD